METTKADDVQGRGARESRKRKTHGKYHSSSSSSASTSSHAISKHSDVRQGSGKQIKAEPPSKKSRPVHDDPRPGPSSATSLTPVGGTQSKDVVPLRERTLGTKGRRLRIWTNYLELLLGNLKRAVHYDVAIEPDQPRRLFHAAMNEFRIKYHRDILTAYDGNKSLYSARLLTEDTATPLDGRVTIDDDGKDVKFAVNIKFASYVDLDALRSYVARSGTKLPPMNAIQCIDVVLRQAHATRFVRVGRSFYFPPTRREPDVDLGDGLQMYNGFYQSAVLGWRPLINVDVSHKGFTRTMPVLDLVRQIYGGTEGNRIRDATRLENALKGFKIAYEIPRCPGTKRKYRVNGVERRSAAEYGFNLDDGTRTTIAEYYRRTKRYELRFPQLPCLLWVGARKRDKKTLLPIELCTLLERQPAAFKMTENQTRNMIKHSATNTFVRRNKIMAAIEAADLNNSPYAREFGLEVSKEFVQVDARVLQSPTLKYQQSLVVPKRGCWQAGNFLVGVAIRKWTILNLDRRTNYSALSGLKKMFMQTASRLKVACDNPIEPFENGSQYRGTRELIDYFKKRIDHDLVVVVIPDFGPHYAQVKKVAELNVGVLTQCLCAKTLSRRLNPSTIANILLKVNAKLNGTNHVLNVKPKSLDADCMLLGADVTHPSPGATEPSVAAVIASHDADAFKYNLCWRLQPPRQEIISDMRAIVAEQLDYFEKCTARKPRHIIYIRDGVADSQFEHVLATELQAIREACTAKTDGSSKYRPAITFIVVQKRHHTRFFPRREDCDGDRNFNAPVATCVDTTITSRTAQDFYLLSHASLQGVARPTKYRVLCDDKNMHEDELEELMYFLCHMFTRCTRSVSYPAPTYYAHLAAARAKVYCAAEPIDLERLDEAQNNLTVKKKVLKDFPMFFV